MQPKHPWWARLTVSTIMLILAFFGILLTDIRASGGWEYWKWTIPVYALLGLWLSWYTRRTKDTISPITLGHELLHWLGLFASIFLVSVYVEMGILSRSLAGLVALTLLALTIFIAGVYIETTFLLVGLILGVFASLVAITVKYLYAFSIPVLLIGVGTILFMVWRSKPKIEP